MSDDIRLSSNTVVVPWEKRSELMRRLENAGQREAAEDLRTRRALTESRKPGVLVVLDRWLEEIGVDAFGDELMELRHELDRDVNGPKPHT